MVGVNPGLGLAYRGFFEPLYPEKGAAFYEASTVLLLDPYLGIGYAYRLGEQAYVSVGLSFFPFHLLFADRIAEATREALARRSGKAPEEVRLPPGFPLLISLAPRIGLGILLR